MLGIVGDELVFEQQKTTLVVITMQKCMVNGKAVFLSQTEGCVDKVSYAVKFEFDANEKPLIIDQIETVN